MVSASLLLATFLMALILGVIITPRIVRLAHELHLYDIPNSRKVHKLPIPRLGGVAFLPSIIISIATVVAVASRFDIPFSFLSEHGAPQHFIAYLAGAFMLYCLGIYDDVKGVSYKRKFQIEIVAATLLCISGLWIASFEHIFFIDNIPYWIGMPFTILFVVYLTNAMNLIDGIDGLASGLASISFLVCTILCYISKDIIWAMLSIAFLGTLLTFFYYNVIAKKNKIFMGDAGSLVLGFSLSFMVLHFWQANPIWNPVLHNLGIVVLSTLIIPMLDVIRVMMSRLRDHRNPFLPDKNHIHHKLMRAGLTGRQTMVTLLFISALFIISNYLVAALLSQTLILVIDILMFFLMHLILNRFIYAKEEKEGKRWNREIQSTK